MTHTRTCPAYGNYQPPYETCNCGYEATLGAVSPGKGSLAATEQPAPTLRADLPCIQDLVVADIEARKALGQVRYGTVLRPFNGRDALLDAYQEALDLAIYLRQAIEERSESV